MIRYLLDTHAAVWLLEGSDKLGAGARAAIQTEEALAIAGVTLLEIAMLERRGTISLRPNAGAALEAFAEKLTVLPIDAKIAADAVVVGLPQRDPFDRVITATARMLGLTLVTKDSQITKAQVVQTIW